MQGNSRLFRESSGTPLQYSCLENPMDGGAWRAVVHGVAKSQTRLSDFSFTFHFHALEKEMATHSSVLAWRIPGTREPGGLLSLGSHRVGHDWSDLAAAAAATEARILEWFAIASSYGPRFLRTLHYDLSILGGSAQHGSYLHCVIMQTPSLWQGCDPWRGTLILLSVKARSALNSTPLRRPPSPLFKWL